MYEIELLVHTTTYVPGKVHCILSCQVSKVRPRHRYTKPPYSSYSSNKPPADDHGWGVWPTVITDASTKSSSFLLSHSPLGLFYDNMDTDYDDDIVFPYTAAPRRSHGYFERTPSSPPDPTGMSSTTSDGESTSVWRWLLWMADFFTGPNFGVLMAIVFIFLLQFKSGIMSFFSNAVEDGWQQTLLDCFYGFQDVSGAYYQMACELVRSFRYGNSPPPNRLVNRPQGLVISSAPPPLVVLPSEEEAIQTSPDVNANVNAHAIPRNSRCSYNQARISNTQQKSTASVSSAITSEQAPVSVPLAPSAASCLPSSQEEIEPAFLDESDYPPGWLVYHPTLGVVPKAEADEYDRDNPHPPPPILAPSIAASG